jgi:aminoglycoside 6'-N-acetyltransferase I
VLVRSVRKADLDVWLEMRCALWSEGLRDEHLAEIQSYFAGTAGEPLEVLLAEDDQRVAGFAELSIRSYAEGCASDRVTFLEGWYVKPEYRRRGVGKATDRD